jgi:hypothetical protein
MALIRTKPLRERLSSEILLNLTTAEETRSELLVAMSIPSEAILAVRTFDNVGDLGAAEERFSFDSLQDRTIARGSVDVRMFSPIFSLVLIEPDCGRVTQLYTLRDSRAARVNRHD